MAAIIEIKPQRSSLILNPKGKKEKREISTLSAELQTLLSNLYMDVAGRICLTYPLRCAQDLTYCVENHYNAGAELPSHTQTANLRCTWQQGRYVEFIQTATDMCVRAEFPGEGIFAKLMELILTTSSPKQAYVSVVKLFRLFVHTFPPCWLELRGRYVNFFRKNIQIPKLFSNNIDSVSKTGKVFELMLTLIEHTYNDYAELLKKASENPEAMLSSQNTSTMETSTIKSQCFSEWNWNDFNTETSEFYKLKSDARLERINVVMELMLEILEIDLTMWLLHHYRKPIEFIFYSEKTPLVVMIFEMSESVRMTLPVKRLFTIFSKAVAMELDQTHLKILERYIALAMVSSHVADIENFMIGIRYPSLQINTKNFIHSFYKIFKANNTTSIKNFLTVIDLLRIPFVRFEFIDRFLHIFYHTHEIPIMSPAKVVNDLFRKFWTKYRLQVNIQNADEELSREQFLVLLFKALYAYCEFYGLERVMRYIACGEIVRPLQTVSTSVHHQPNRGRTGDVFLLEKMENDKNVWIKKLRLKVRMARPKIDYETAHMCIDNHVVVSYRHDLKHCWLLSDIINKIASLNPTIDFSEWRKFAMMFKSATIT